MNHETTTPPGPEVWGHRGACRDKDPDLFFPLGQGPSYRAQVEEALRVCAGCPVRNPCRTWALSAPQQQGIVGGLTEEDRGAVAGSPAADDPDRLDVGRVADAVREVLSGHPGGLDHLNRREVNEATARLSDLRGPSEAAKLLGVCDNTVYRRRLHARDPESARAVRRTESRRRRAAAAVPERVPA